MTKREPQDYAAVCGLYWAGSAWYEVLQTTCATQAEAEAALVNLCPVYACARERGVLHCGLCPGFPCPLLTNLASVTPGDRRIESAELRARLGDDRWAEWARGQHLWLAFCPGPPRRGGLKGPSLAGYWTTRVPFIPASLWPGTLQ